MEWLVGPIAVLVVVAVCATPFALRAAVRRRRRDDPGYAPPGFGGGPFEELYHPAAYEAKLLRDAQTVVPAPAPTPGDPPLESGRIRIRVTSAPPREPSSEPTAPSPVVVAPPR